jgi:hypothetical protein
LFPPAPRSAHADGSVESIWWAQGAHVVVTWRLGEVAPAWQ